MPGKGWNSILDLALSLAGLEASNEGIGTEASLGDALKVNFPKQVEEAKRIIAKEQGVRAIQWKEFLVSLARRKARHLRRTLSSSWGSQMESASPATLVLPTEPLPVLVPVLVRSCST